MNRTRYCRRDNGVAKPGFDFEEWKTKYMNFATENAPKWVNEVKEKYGKTDTKFCCVG